MPKRSALNITSKAAETASPGLLWDGKVSGLGLRTLASGKQVWLLKYRGLDGRQHWHQFGEFPAMTPAEARDEGERLRVLVRQGKNPSLDRKAERQAAEARQAAAVNLLAESYAQALPGRPSLRGSGAISAAHAAAEADAVKRAIARMDLEGRPVSEVTATDLLGLLRLEASRPATARMMFSAFGRFMEWCREGKHISTNPCEAVPRAKRPKPPPARRRVVALADLARIWRAAGVLPAPLGDLARLLVAVPVRRGEAARLAWQDVNLAEGVWTLPGTITKNGDQHSIALPALALRLLRARHKAMGQPTTGLAFPSPRANKPVMAWTAMKAEISTAARFTAWTWHDFRRSFASLMAERGVAEPVADAVLNHRQSSTRGGVLGVYQHAQRRPEQEAAMRAWGLALAAAIKADADQQKGKARAPRATASARRQTAGTSV